MNNQSHEIDFAQLMSAVLDKRFIKITPKPGQSHEDAIAEHEAAHRKECAECAAEHEAELKATAEKVAADSIERQLKRAAEADLVAKQDKAMDAKAVKHFSAAAAREFTPAAGAAAVVIGQMDDRFIIQVPQGSSVKVGTDLFDIPQFDFTESAKRTPIGYMAFGVKDNEPIKGSFETDRAVIEKKLAKFNALPELEMLRAIVGSLGRDLTGIADVEIRPVFGE